MTMMTRRLLPLRRRAYGHRYVSARALPPNAGLHTTMSNDDDDNCGGTSSQYSSCERITVQLVIYVRTLKFQLVFFFWFAVPAIHTAISYNSYCDRTVYHHTALYCGHGSAEPEPERWPVVVIVVVTAVIASLRLRCDRRCAGVGHGCQLGWVMGLGHHDMAWECYVTYTSSASNAFFFLAFFSSRGYLGRGDNSE
jgi:hypothetical protein